MLILDEEPAHLKARSAQLQFRNARTMVRPCSAAFDFLSAGESRAWAIAGGAMEEAQRLGLQGWVRNRLDGSVEFSALAQSLPSRASSRPAAGTAGRRGDGHRTQRRR